MDMEVPNDDFCLDDVEHLHATQPSELLIEIGWTTVAR